MKQNISTILIFAGILWGVEIINLMTGNALCSFGIIPRTMTGLPGILFAPFIHRDIFHLCLNTVPFIILGTLVSIRGLRAFVEISLIIIIGGGVLVWLFARPAIHMGASGLIYGYFGFLAASGWYERKFSSILISLAVIFIYGGLVWGVLPLYRGISWEGHLTGMVVGVLTAKIAKKQTLISQKS